MTANTAKDCHGSNQNTDCHCHTPIGVAAGSDGTAETEVRTDIPDLDRLRALAEQRVRDQVAAAAERRDRQAETRQVFAANRRHGLTERYAAKQARLRLTAAHNTPDGDDAA